MIITTDNLNSQKAIFENLDSSTLVIFDVDDVLFEPCDQILRGHYFKEVLIFQHMIEEKYDKKTAEKLFSIIWNDRHIKVMEEETPILIESLQENNIPVFALTNCMIGPYGLTKSVEEWRLRELAKCGYHLGRPWMHLHERLFLHGDEVDFANCWLYKEGVIFTNGLPKGEVLEEFLQYFQLKPKNIIFVDDLLKNIISVQDMCTKSGINFTAIEYIKATSKYQRPNSLDIAKMQIHVLEKERKWITDQEARTLLASASQQKSEEIDFPWQNFHIDEISPDHPFLPTLIVYSIGNPAEKKIKDVLANYKAQDRILLGAFLSAKLVGVVGVQIQEKQLTILHMSVLPELQAEGLGTKLLDFINNKFADYEIFLETDTEAVGFYQKFGFACVPFKSKYERLRYRCHLPK